MKFDLTRQTFTQTLFISALVIFIYWGVVLMNARNIYPANELSGIMPMGTLITNFTSKYSLLSIIITIILQLFNALYISRVFIRNVVYAKQTYIASVLYILISISSPITNQELILQFIAALSLLALEGVLNVKKRVNSSHNFFLSSLLISIATLIFLPTISLFFCIISIFFIYNRFSFRELLASIGGLLIPFFLCSYYYWATQDNILQVMQDIVSTTKSSFSVISIEAIQNMNIFDIVFIVAIITVMIFSLVNFITNIEITRYRTRHAYILFWVFAIVIISVFILSTPTRSSIIPLFAIPASIIISFLFNILKDKVITNIIFVVLVILTVLANIL